MTRRTWCLGPVTDESNFVLKAEMYRVECRDAKVEVSDLSNANKNGYQPTVEHPRIYFVLSMYHWYHGIGA